MRILELVCRCVSHWNVTIIWIAMWLNVKDVSRQQFLVSMTLRIYKSRAVITLLLLRYKQLYS